MGSKLSVGVTGHRFFRQSGSQEFVQSLSDIFTELEQQCNDGFPVLYSGLADGADCEVAELAIIRGWELIAVLAGPEAEFALEHAPSKRTEVYAKLLGLAQGIIIAAPAGTSSPERYCKVGDQIIQSIDHLIAVWDGDASNAMPGGTAWVVAKFLQSGTNAVGRLHHLKVNRA